MNRRRLKIATLTALAVLTLGIFRYILTLFEENSGKKKGQKPHLIESYVEGVRFSQFDARGKIKNALTATRASQYTDSTTIELQSPDVLVNSSKQWRITSQRGSYDTGLETYEAKGQVSITRMDHFVKVETEKLDYNFETDLIYTDEAIQIHTANGNISAKGMTVDLNKETLELHHNIESQYDPKEK